MFLPADTTHFQVAGGPLKHLLRLFAPEAPLHVRALGDTWHPSAGYVEQELVREVRQVADLLAFPYDFAGLVYLDATVADITLTYHAEHYRLSGPPKTLQLVLAQLRALNALPGAPPLRIVAATQGPPA